jgi:hypothetical protein
LPGASAAGAVTESPAGVPQQAPLSSGAQQVCSVAVEQQAVAGAAAVESAVVVSVPVMADHPLLQVNDFTEVDGAPRERMHPGCAYFDHQLI